MKKRLRLLAIQILGVAENSGNPFADEEAIETHH